MWGSGWVLVFRCVLVFVLLCTALNACGDEDLVFPGDIPIPTIVVQPTETPGESQD